jgi:hypothetical protein
LIKLKLAVRVTVSVSVAVTGVPVGGVTVTVLAMLAGNVCATAACIPANINNAVVMLTKPVRKVVSLDIFPFLSFLVTAMFDDSCAATPKCLAWAVLVVLFECMAVISIQSQNS